MTVSYTHLDVYKRQGDIKALIHEQKQMQKHTTAELVLLRGDVGELRGELNNQITRVSDVEESMSNKIAEVEKSVLSVEEAMPTKISAVENSMANISCLLYTSRCV